jgi:HK97 gp10 family phage protein
MARDGCIAEFLMAELVNVKGLADLQKFLDRLPVKLERNVMRSSMRHGANLIRNDAKARAPVGPPSQKNRRLYGGYAGALRDSIRVGTSARGGKVTAYIRAGGRNKKTGAAVFYTHFLEYGTKAHNIAARVGGWLKIGNLFAKAVEHPGITARPFMRPAMDTQAQAALQAMAAHMRATLARKHGLDTTHIKLDGDE